jgi:Undecaprenyl-phosphate galactose phosphotransferase WbaP
MRVTCIRKMNKLLFYSKERSIVKKTVKIRSSVVRALTVMVDLLTIAAVFSALVVLRKSTGGSFDLHVYYRLWPFLIVFWLVFHKLGLYNGTSIYSCSSIGPIEEIRRIFYGTAAVCIALGFSNYCYRPDDYLYSRSILIGTFLILIVILPINRILFRKALTQINCWGVPAILIGSGKTARQVFTNMHRHSEYGLIPVGFFSDNGRSEMPEKAVYLGKIDEIDAVTSQMDIKYAILAKDAPPNAPHIQQIISRYGTRFPHLLIIPPPLLDTCTGVTPKDIGGILGLEIRHNLQIPAIYRIKRVLDFALTLPALMIALPFIGVLTIWIKLDSPGPAFFKHRRVTKNGRQIHIYKFRTMINGAEKQLQTVLEAAPELKKEWKQYGKLRNDPRITRAGRWLRKTSLDELPQLFNVLQGKLTLVGPRPLIQEELEIYGEAASLFDRVLPGLTGLWQVSGRNELTYSERSRLDLYYVNNWSVWLDLYILAKTVYAVLFRNGAR